MNQHFGETAKLVNYRSKSDSFVNHFTKHFKGDDRDVTVHAVSGLQSAHPLGGLPVYEKGFLQGNQSRLGLLVRKGKPV